MLINILLFSALVNAGEPFEKTRFDLMCNEKTEGNQRQFIWIWANHFQSKTPRSLISMRLNEKKPDGNFEYKYSIPGFYSILRKNAGPAIPKEIHYYTFTSPNGRTQIDVFQPDGQTKKIHATSYELEETVRTVREFECDQAVPMDNIGYDSTVEGSKTDGLRDYLVEIKHRFLFDEDHKKTAEDFLDYYQLQERLIKEGKDQMTHWSARNLSAAQELAAELVPFFKGRLTGAGENWLENSEVIKRFEAIETPYTWQ